MVSPFYTVALRKGIFGTKKAQDTSLGGAARQFPATTWGLIAKLRETAQHRAALEDLCRRYWKPVYAWVRVAWAKSNEDAKDLTQAFFLWLLDGEPLKKYEPERGGFRGYLKLLLRRFVGHQEVALKRLKRGGGIKHISIEDDGLVADARETDPEKLFDRSWITEMVNQAVKRVWEDAEEVAVHVYERFEFAPEGERPTYKQLSEDLGISLKEVKNHLFAIREKVRAEIRADLRNMTADDRELEEEWNVLFRS